MNNLHDGEDVGGEGGMPVSNVYHDICKACIMYIVHLPDLDRIGEKYYRHGNINAAG